MELLLLVMGLYAVALLVALGARAVKVPFPIALVLAGTALSLVPELPEIPLNTHLLLAIILPPVLYQAAMVTSWRDFRANLWPISLLAFGLVLVTTLALGVVAKMLLPDLPWALAFALGAILSPPDAVAATAVFGKMRLPRRMITIIEGESLVNDASGLVLYKFAVVALLSGAFSFAEATVDFAWVCAAGVLIGAAMGYGLAHLQRLFNGDSTAEMTLSLLTPYAAYLLADALGASAVLAVVAVGVVRSWILPRYMGPMSRLQILTMWDTIVFFVNTFIFMLIGLHLAPIVGGITVSEAATLSLQAVLLAGVAIAVRFLWVLVGVALPKIIGLCPAGRVDWRSGVVVSWAGMRGVVSLVAAIALPVFYEDGSPVPLRDEVVFLCFGVILITLVGQGLTVGTVARWMGFGRPDDTPDTEEHGARRFLLEEGERALSDLAQHDRLPSDIVAHIRRELVWRMENLHDAPDPRLGAHHHVKNRLRLTVVRAEREALHALRHERKIGDDVFLKLQRELDLEELRLTFSA